MSTHNAPPTAPPRITTVTANGPGRSGAIASPAHARDDRARVELPLAADVVEVHPEREGRGESREDQRCRGRQRVGEAVPVPEAGPEELLVHAQRRVTGEREEDRTQRERDEHRRDRHDEHGAALDLQPPLEVDVEAGDDHCVTPAIASPMSSRRRVLGRDLVGDRGRGRAR